MNHTGTLKKHASDIVLRLRDAGFKALFAGGAVRDMIMGIEPRDYDISTNASIGDIECLFDRVHPVGSQFGVCLVIMGGGSIRSYRLPKRWCLRRWEAPDYYPAGG
ncbi:hypothetical protein ACFL47_09365 [Candidatus Latescibacterota bacterium]